MRLPLFHERWRRRVSLLAAGALSGEERAATQLHLTACGRCRGELDSLRRVLRLAASDPARSARPPIAAPFLLARVLARLAEEPVAPEPMPAWRRALWPALAAAAVVVGVLSVAGPGLAPPPPVRLEAREIALPDEALSRLERNVAREQAARYLNEAQDLLVTVAASPQRCDRGSQRVDVAQEARRGRELLARRALLVEMDRAEVAPARLVLEDVERMLREVAALEACARRQDVQAIHREMERSRLLMKIDLTTRELLG